MSEEIDLESNNLCAAEDAFEKFSAKSMYNEDEYMTLSDIASPTYRDSEPSSDLREIPYDNEIVVSSNSDQVHHDVNIEPTCDSDTGNKVITEPESLTAHKEDENLCTTISDSTDNIPSLPSKRVRKKKSYYDDDEFSPYRKKTGSIHQHTGKKSINVQNSELNSSLTSTPKKRGRKPKNKTLVPLEEQSPVVTNTTIYDKSDTSELRLSTEIATVEKCISSSTQPQKRRPGRPKKTKEDSSISEPDSTINHDSIIDSGTTSDEPLVNIESIEKMKGGRISKPKIIEEKTNSDLSEIKLDITNTNSDLKDILEGRSPSHGDIANKSVDISSTQTDNGAPNNDVTNYEKDGDEIHNKLSEMFSDEETAVAMECLAPNSEEIVVEPKPESPIETTSLNDSSLVVATEHTKQISKSPKTVKKSKKKKSKDRKVNVTEKNTKEESSCILDSVATLNATDDNDDGEDICLSKLKENMKPSNTENNQEGLVIDEEEKPTSTETEQNNLTEPIVKRSTKVPIRDDFEYNVDTVVGEFESQEDKNASLLVEDTSKRSVRKRRQMQYEIDSDEDPFANVELSDDELPKRHRKGKSNSDDEYIPSMEIVNKRAASESGSDDMQLNEDIKRLQKKRKSKKVGSGSPRKRGKKSQDFMDNDEVQTIDSDQDNDVEKCVEPLLIKKNTNASSNIWGNTNEFEVFLATKIANSNIKIKKCTDQQNKNITPLEIPVIDQNEPKKFVNEYVQTNISQLKDGSSQTNSPYDIPMKDNVILTKQQSEKACEFLNNVVTTTVELGKLMTEKSEDFIKKKINTNHVTDTMKMDYCVKKSFLLFTLAKHNLEQMEKDLAKQYEEFLITHDLLKCRMEPKKLTPNLKPTDDDSDCEIIETPENVKVDKNVTKSKPTFNPKTVFLNKELSIKIAKKPTETERKIQMRGKHAVWINDSVMVKKVKPTQSFLAQDSRNKKPPDNFITAGMVNNSLENYYRHEVFTKIVKEFFKNYNHQKVVEMCAPFTSSNWLSINKPYVCNYFVVTKDLVADVPLETINNRDGINRHTSQNATVSTSTTDVKGFNPMIKFLEPESLFTLCMRHLQKHLFHKNISIANDHLNGKIENGPPRNIPRSLLQLCIYALKFDPDIEPRSNSPNYSLCDSQSSISLCDDSSICENYNFEDLQETVIRNPFSLFQLCVNAINELLLKPRKTIQRCNDTMHTYKFPLYSVSTLKTLCYKSIINIFCNDKISQKPCMKVTNINSCSSIYSYNENELLDIEETDYFGEKIILKEIKTLNTLCIEKIQSYMNLPVYTSANEEHRKYLFSPDCLKAIAFKSIINIYFRDLKDLNTHSNEDIFTIDCVNTLSEEAFHNLDHTTMNNIEDSDMADEDSNVFEDEYQEHFENDEEANHEEQVNGDDNWLAQLQLEEPRSCVTPNELNQENEAETNTMPVIANVKIEPEEDATESIVDTTLVKTEPLQNPNEMTVIPENVVTKSEIMVNSPNRDVENERRSSASYDVDAFESFVLRHKLMHSLNDYNSEEIFTQSMFRVRRQFQPDYEDVNDLNNSLLVPQTFEPLLGNAKDSLMKSSSDEGSSSKNKTVGKKKVERKKTRAKKVEAKASKDTQSAAKEKVPTDIAIMTRRMREKIRQEEKKNESTDSESEKATLHTLKETEKLKDKTLKSKDTSKVKSVPSNELPIDKNLKTKSKATVKSKTVPDNEIQCNAVDSTEQVNETVDNKNCDIEKQPTSTVSSEENLDSAIDVVNDHFLLSMLDFSEPAENVECEPTMPIFDDDVGRKTRRSAGPKRSKVESNLPVANNVTLPEQLSSVDGNIQEKEPEVKKPVEQVTFTDRDGWNCYPINANDEKLYQQSCIFLEKLPESFVETYFRYQNITGKTKEDQEVDRLTDLSSLSRTPSMREGKPKSKQKVTEYGNELIKAADDIGDIQPASPAGSDHYAELTPSEDEGDNNDMEPPPTSLPPQQSSEINLAKNSLMNDNDSDQESPVKVKEEPSDEIIVKRRPGPKSKTKMMMMKPPTEDLMLTADKMMNKELTLLHTPVVLNNAAPETPAKNNAPKPKLRSSVRTEKSAKERIKLEEDSSSEEEKQWVNTKEKLLKRVSKKEDAIADDAKRAKLVSEYIERRSDGKESRMRRKTARPRRSRKRILERQKQLRVLSRELLGEPMDSGGVGKTYSQSYSKGRRNIRKVLNKTALAVSTVIANKEEIERKRRLNAKQKKLCEVLGCEEAVNVLVINDEVCLEYDFEEERPVVTIHPFFTKVMKAHQYEGVKFMWDACFESLEMIESGHPGGGCILAHCMGLGKTLQVLALLHTVLTHPRVGMARVLVCCPLSTVLNWVDEIHKWLGPVTNQIKVFELSKLRKTYERAYQLEDWYNGGGIFIIGYELFRSLTTLDPDFDDIRPTIINKIRTALLDPGPDIIVCDEGHLLKNDCSVLAVAMSRVVTKRRIVLTGTPMQNNLREYYCMVNFVKPNLLGKYSEYSNRFENPIMNGQHRDSSEEDIKLMKARTHILHKVLEGCLQRQEASVLYPYLPKKHEYTVFIPLTKCQWDLYKHYIEKYGRKTKSQSILKDFHILQKIWSHPQVLHNFQVKSRDEKNRIKLEKLEDDLAREDLVSEDIKPEDTELWWLNYSDDGTSLDSLESSNKFVAVFRILNECNALGDKVLIFSTSLFSLDGLEYFLKKINKWSLGQEYYRLDGSVPAEVRQKWCREFNAENNTITKLFLISTRAGCLGLNMTAANRVIILDTSWNPAHDIQSIFRVYRFGQKKDCFIYRLVALGTMEQKIYERSVTKQAVACRVVDEQQIERHYNMAELTELYRCDEQGVSVASGVAVGVEDVALLRVARDAPIHAVHEHDSLLRGSTEQGLPEHERNAAWIQFQQEHAHKQMQNEIQMKNQLMKLNNAAQEKPKKGKKSKVANVKLPIPPETSKEVNNEAKHNENSILPSFEPTVNANQPNTTDIEPGVDTDDNSKKDADYVPRYRFREKKGRKQQTQIPPTNVQEKKTEQAQADEVYNINLDRVNIMEEEMIHGITQILKEHNFVVDNEPHKIMSLVNNVKNLVFGGGSTTDDTLSKHIAKFAIRRKLDSIPALTHYICQAISRSRYMPPEPTPAPKKRGRPFKQKKQVSEDVTNTPSTSVVTPIIEISVKHNNKSEKRESRSRTRAMLEQKSKEDSQKVINLIDDKQSTVETNTHASKETVNTKEQTIITAEESILLSDEDDIPLQVILPKPEKPKVVPEKPKLVPEKPKVVQSREKIPLHPSLLTNKHFIKIVAHTYLDGNKMLDEDAAILAAKYSTEKTLREYETTGKSIESGPIYDIAVEVLGLDFLRKVNLSNPVVQQPPSPPPPTFQPDPVQPKISLKVKDNLTRTPAQEDKVVLRGTAAPLNKKMKVTSEPIQTPPKEPQLISQAQPVPAHLPAKPLVTVRNLPTEPKPVRLEPMPPLGHTVPVVPVGLFRTANVPAPAFMQPSDGECILPDDDDVHIINDEPTIVSTNNPVVTNTSNPVPVGFAHRNSHSLILNPVPTGSPSVPWRVVSRPSELPAVSQMPETTAPLTQKRHMIKISGNVIEGATSYDVSKQPTPDPVPTPYNAPICLDSDEDESITPNIESIAPKPKPSAPTSQPVTPILGSLRAIGPAGEMIPVVPHTMTTTCGNIINKKITVLIRKKVNGDEVTPILTEVGDKDAPPKSTNILRLTKTGQLVMEKWNKQNEQMPVTQTQEPVVQQNQLMDNTVLQDKGVVSENVPVPNKTIELKKKKVEANTIVQDKSIMAEKKKVQDSKIVSEKAKVRETTKLPDRTIVEKALMSERAKLRDKANLPDKTQVPDKKIVPEKRPIRVHSTSSSSNVSSRSNSPNDPLSILKDVVQIQAADETSKKPSKSSISKNTEISTINLVDKYVSKHDKRSHDSGDVRKPTPSTSKSDSTNYSILKSSTQTELKKSDGVTKKFGSKSATDIKTKSANNTLSAKDTIDLTDTNTLTKFTSKSGKNFVGIILNKTNKTSEKKSDSVPISGVKVVGTTKNLVFNGKAITTKDNTASKQVATSSSSTSDSKSLKLKFPKLIPCQAPKLEKRRQSVLTPPVAPKKQKFSSMTLKDFNLDDIEDVIELE